MTYEETQRRFHVVANRQALRMLIKYNRLSYRDVARRAGVAHGTVGDLVSGRRRTCNPETAEKIERALGADPNTIFSVKALPVVAAGHEAA